MGIHLDFIDVHGGTDILCSSCGQPLGVAGGSEGPPVLAVAWIDEKDSSRSGMMHLGCARRAIRVEHPCHLTVHIYAVDYTPDVADCWTVWVHYIYTLPPTPEEPEHKYHVYSSLGLSESPLPWHPQGFSQWGPDGPRTGPRSAYFLSNMPRNLQRHVIERAVGDDAELLNDRILSVSILDDTGQRLRSEWRLALGLDSRRYSIVLGEGQWNKQTR